MLTTFLGSIILCYGCINSSNPSKHHNEYMNMLYTQDELSQNNILTNKEDEPYSTDTFLDQEVESYFISENDISIDEKDTDNNIQFQETNEDDNRDEKLDLNDFEIDSVLANKDDSDKVIDNKIRCKCPESGDSNKKLFLTSTNINNNDKKVNHEDNNDVSFFINALKESEDKDRKIKEENKEDSSILPKDQESGKSGVNLTENDSNTKNQPEKIGENDDKPRIENDTKEDKDNTRFIEQEQEKNIMERKNDENINSLYIKDGTKNDDINTKEFRPSQPLIIHTKRASLEPIQEVSDEKSAESNDKTKIKTFCDECSSYSDSSESEKNKTLVDKNTYGDDLYTNMLEKMNISVFDPSTDENSEFIGINEMNKFKLIIKKCIDWFENKLYEYKNDRVWYHQPSFDRKIKEFVENQDIFEEEKMDFRFDDSSLSNCNQIDSFSFFPEDNINFVNLIYDTTKKLQFKRQCSCINSNLCLLYIYTSFKRIIEKYPEWKSPEITDIIDKKLMIDSNLKNVLQHVYGLICSDSKCYSFVLWKNNNKLKYLLDPMIIEYVKRI